MAFTSAAAASGGASQPVAAMTHLQNLNKSSARLATFPVRCWGGRLVEYTYQNRTNKAVVQAHKFETVLVGQNAQEYCIGFVKGTKAVCNEAMAKYPDGSVFTLSKVCFDGYTQAAFISTSVQFRVDLTKSQITILDDTSDTHGALCRGMPEKPQPPRTVAECARIGTNRSTDLIAMIKAVSPGQRRSRSGEDIVDVELMDNSESSPGKLGYVTVSIFGRQKIEAVRQGQTMMFLGLKVTCSGRGTKPTINHFSDEVMTTAPDCDKTRQLVERRADLVSTPNSEQLTTEWTPQTTLRDVTGDHCISCAAFFELHDRGPRGRRARDQPCSTKRCGSVCYASKWVARRWLKWCCSARFAQRQPPGKKTPRRHPLDGLLF